jgi:tetrahydromethanopterin S-methyltransferase subunit E
MAIVILSFSLYLLACVHTYAVPFLSFFFGVVSGGTGNSTNGEQWW